MLPGNHVRYRIPYRYCHLNSDAMLSSSIHMYTQRVGVRRTRLRTLVVDAADVAAAAAVYVVAGNFYLHTKQDVSVQ